MKQKVDAPILSVSELNQYARGVLEMNVGKVWVTGEISNLSRPASGHWYFTLKDQQAQIRCAMFRNKNRLVRANLANGMQILVNGSPSIYEGRGDFQLIADYLEESGIGALQRQFEQLKQKLQAEGLFAQDKKQAIPKNPKHIAVITSATGAAIQDILKVLKERFPSLKVTLIPSLVQGEGASQSLCHALMMAERWNTEELDAFDAIIIGRGGGSLEDLWAFNEETLARAIFACKIPVISAVGHEVDVTISDYVADLRAATPSAAAEIISPDTQAIAQHLDHIEQRLIRQIRSKLEKARSQTELLNKSLTHPGERIKQLSTAFEQKLALLTHSAEAQLQSHSHQLALYEQQLTNNHPKHKLESMKDRFETLHPMLTKLLKQELERQQNRINQSAKMLDALSPLSTLSRGYAINSNDQGDVIHDINQVAANDIMHTRVSNGTITSKVLTKEPSEANN